MKLKVWFNTIVICVLVLAGLAAVKTMQIRSAIAFAESFPEPSETVVSSYSELQPYVDTISVLGEVIAPRKLDIYSEVSGKVVEVGFKSGELVQAGQLLIQQDISEETALLDSARASLDLAESIFRRNKNLYESNAVSEDEYDRARVELATVKAEIARLESVIRKKTITAPFTGVTGIHQFEVGLVLGDNEMITVLVGQEKYRWIDFTVPQFYPELSKGVEVQVQLLSDDPTALVDWLPASVVAKSSVVDRSTRSFYYRAQTNSDADLPIHSGVNVRIPVKGQQSLVTIPVTALQQDNLGSFVYLLEPDQSTNAFRAKRQNVQVKVKQTDHVFLQSGLQQGHLIATDGAFKLYPGVLVFSEPPQLENQSATD